MVNAGSNTVDLFDIEINKSGGSSVTFTNGTYVLNGTLYPTLGNIIMDAAPTQFIVNSISGVGGARIAAVSSGSSITGNVTVRRYIEPGVADWRCVASPVTGATLLDWDDNIAISGVGFPDGCAIGTGDACFYSVKRTTINAYVDVTNILQPLTNGKGFDVYMGDDTIVFSGVTLDVTGTVHGSADYVVNFNHGWNLQGNALVSPVVWSSLTKSHVGNYYYIYDTGAETWNGMMERQIHPVQQNLQVVSNSTRSRLLDLRFQVHYV
ncbi:MAG: hypothetical protein IPG07_16095 [Crocinitomicaceae bacterium]|nr:hypothetical protein [Crocinitomicaceae bacterium]